MSIKFNKIIKLFREKWILFGTTSLLVIPLFIRGLGKGRYKMEGIKERYVFKNVDTLVQYLYSRFGNLSPLKLQKGLYFLYAYYGAVYGEAKQSEGESEQDLLYPSRLFDETFEAWTYGPVVRSVYNKNKSEHYKPNKDMELDEFKEYPDIQRFIDELFEQINSVSDFSLVDRSHEDLVWKAAYDKGKSTVMDNEAIIREYREKYV